MKPNFSAYRIPHHAASQHRQNGVAVIMALLLTTLAITIVASLFWQQQVQVRLIENQRLQLQKQWILRGALDWASLILREDAKYSSVDTLDEPWATPLAETRLDQYVENGKADSDIADTTLSGSINDAQARFNLNNLVKNGTVNPAAVSQFAKLLTSLKLDATLAEITAKHIALATPVNTETMFNAPTATPPLTESAHSLNGKLAPSPTQPVAAASNVPTSSTMSNTQVDDLLAVPGYTVAQVERLKNFVIFLPRETPININTAPAEVIAAMVNNLSLTDANTLLASRKTASFRDLADVSNRLINKTFNANDFSVSSNYFLINGKVHMNRARLDMQALLERNGAVTKLLWIREF